VLRTGSLRLFQFAGINVYVHWTWLLVAFFQVQYRARGAGDGDSLMPTYESARWYWIEYLALFAIVLMHEFGHALACRQVGGFADHIVLWPLGGIALVRPPMQPGALLWTIVAGPLVNVLLLPVLGGLVFLSHQLDWAALNPDLPAFLVAILWINVILLVFNLIPVYPMDGGQILHALLWFIFGRAESLLVVSILGMVLGGSALLLSLLTLQPWLCMVCAFIVYMAYAGFRQGRVLSRVLRGPRRQEAACPSCGVSPLIGNYWTCDECGTRFDTFGCRAQCPGCGKLFRVTRCPECYKQYPIGDWFAAAAPHEDYPDYAPR
jgi:Zn-dependent protease